MKKKIGVFGGTFDPIHYGHLLFAEQVRSLCKLEKVIFIPAKFPPHKIEDEVTSIDDRFEMVKQAIESNAGFQISDIEKCSDDLSFTYNTLSKLKQMLSEDYELYFILGADAWLEIENWYKSESLFKEFSFIIGDRPGYKEDFVEKQINKIKDKYETKIFKIDILEIEISSSNIRELARKNLSFKYLTPEVVENYINNFHLYK